MARKSGSVAALASVLLLLTYACTEGGRTPVSGSDARLEAELASASEVRELIAIRDEIVSLALARGVTADEIRAAGCDAAAANRLLGLTEAAARERFERIDALLEALYARFPVLGGTGGGNSGAPSACGACDIERIAESWERSSRALAAGLAAGGAPPAPEREPLTCKMRQLIVGFAVCAARSGGSLLFYSLCSYGVFCGSCSGGIASVICQ